MGETQLKNGLDNSQTPKKEEEIECEIGKNAKSDNQSTVSGSRCTRSQAAPDWTVHESMSLLNEINATEGECRNTLPSFQRWKMIVSNCKALGVHRSMNQCKRKWDSLLAEYKQIKEWETEEARARSYWYLDGDGRKEFGLPIDFDSDLFRVIDNNVKTQDGGPDTDPDSDPEAVADVLKVIAATGFKKRKRSSLPQKHGKQGRVKPRRFGITGKIKPEHCSLKGKVEPPERSIEEKMIPDKSSLEGKEEMMAAKLRENAELMNAILEGNLTEDVDYTLADLKNVEAFEMDTARRQGEKLIACLGNVADTLKQLCDLVQECG